MTPRYVVYVDHQRHTLPEYLGLYRAGKVGPLQYASPQVPVVACAHCSAWRPDDGTRCSFCGAYQRCALEPLTAVLSRRSSTERDAAEWPGRRARPGAKSVNPRRKKHHA